MTEKANAGRRAPHAARLIDELTDVLGPRVAERIVILEELLRSSHADVVGDALFGAKKLIDRWRGDFDELIRLIAGHLAHPDTRIAEQAARALRDWGPLAAPVADSLAQKLAALDALPWRDGLPAWTIPYRPEPGLASVVYLLGSLGDERALPYLLASLELKPCPHDTGFLLSRYPQHAERIVATILPLLPVLDVDERKPMAWHSFQAALGSFGAVSAPAVPQLLKSPLDAYSARTLGRIGPAASDAVPALRVAATGDDDRLAVAAAGALWRIERSPAALSLLTAKIDGGAGSEALREIAAMGDAAQAAAPYVATFLQTPGPNWWQPTLAAIALWRISGDATQALPTLIETWHGSQHVRSEIAQAAAGPLAAGLEPLLRAELAESRRHALSDSGWSSGQVGDDEELLAACRAALISLGR
jgi:hypothetical protein